jgi:hypothetical protein
MTWRPQPLPPVPEATAAAVRAAFPRGNLYVDLSAEFGTLYEESIQIWGLRRLSFTLLDREIGVPTAEYGR